jgi:tetratricopeptide (TPR) repeat protein
MGTNRPQVNVSFLDPETIDQVSSMESSYETHMAQRGRTFALGMLLVLLVLAVYGVAVLGKFIYLDDQNVVENLALRTWGSGLWAIWAHPTIWPHYQPGWYSALLLEFKLFNVRQPGGYLGISILLHAINVLLLWTLLRKLEFPGAIAASAIFAVHPTNVEAVAWISQQSMVLCGTWSLLLMLIFLRHRGINPPTGIQGWAKLPESAWALYTLSVILFSAALSTHAVAAGLPMVLLVVIWWERGRLTREDLLSLLPLMAMAVVWIALVMIADIRRAATIAASTEAFEPASRWLDAPRVLGTYLMHWIAPVRLSFGYPPPATAMPIQIVFLIGILAIVTLAWGAQRRVGRGPLAAALIFVALFLPLMLVRTDLQRYGASAGDHLAYLPGMTLVVAIVAVLVEIESLSLRHWMRPALTGVAVCGLAVLTVLRIPNYRTARDLWNTALKTNPNSVLACNQLGLIELDERRYSAAMEHFRKALQRDPGDVTTHLNIARAALAAGETDKARMRFQEALTLAPDNPDVHFGLAGVLANLHDTDGAIREYNRVLQSRPDHFQAMSNLGLLYAERGDDDKAMAQYEAAIRVNPNFSVAYINMANLLFERGVRMSDQSFIQQAAQTLKQALALDPTNYGAYLNAGAMVTRMAQGYAADDVERKNLLQQADRFFRVAVSLQPRSAEAHANLAVVLTLNQRLPDAVYEWGKAAELAPDNVAIQRSLARARETLSGNTPRQSD